MLENLKSNCEGATHSAFVCKSLPLVVQASFPLLELQKLALFVVRA